MRNLNWWRCALSDIELLALELRRHCVPPLLIPLLPARGAEIPAEHLWPYYKKGEDTRRHTEDAPPLWGGSA